MPKIPNPPPDDVLQIDLTPYKAFLVDLPEGAMRGMRSEQEGWAAVVQEVVSNQATYGELAGITAADFTQFNDYNLHYDQLMAELPRLQKALEILIESAANTDDRRQRLAAVFASGAESRAQATGNAKLLTAYEKTRAYRSAVGDKAARTRKRNEEKKAEEAKAAGAGTTPPANPPTP